MNIKRIKCILLGGCKFKGGAQSSIDENDNVNITETCCRCGKKYSFTAKYSNFERAAEEIHEKYSAT